ncbi:translation elongation factor Ts [Hathewaya limosa]|uniref:Elongation factor Ts n=1 Tax=Hathewaya limosa TaxID=1536 RepID=A0ABU0JSQ0_HATLI|nr:translation elongation factor Ts [Hathewaya limosa]AWZ48679.1 elongation factor Ts [Clostridiaceae bacterium 14S0207]MDQ0480118.1 elongation factor Ts [Hathewaya limosa]
MISAKMVKELRESTGAGMMDCKKALTEANGDMEKAVEILREKGLAAAAKKAGRVAAEGLVKTYIAEDGKKATIVEVNCETDFVAANEDFIEFVNEVAKQACASSVNTVEELLEEKFIKDESVILKDALTALIAKLGENMSIRRFERFSVENGKINSYIHGNGKIGVLVQLGCQKDDEILSEIAKDVAMQVAAVNPAFLNRDSVDNESLEKEREIYRVQALNEGKPEKIVDKMVDGRINKFYKENCLIEQVWVKNPDLTIQKHLQEEGKKLGADITVEKFARFERGEGIEKKEEDFAEEVKKQMGGN